MNRLRIFGVGVPLLALGMAAHAGSFTFATSAGAKEATGNAVSASAAITTGAGTVTITLSNLFVNPVTVAQNLSDFAFTLNGSGFGSGSLATSSGQEVTVASNGSFSTAGTVPTGWILTSSGGSFKLDDLNGGAGPAQGSAQRKDRGGAVQRIATLIARLPGTARTIRLLTRMPRSHLTSLALPPTPWLTAQHSRSEPLPVTRLQVASSVELRAIASRLQNRFHCL